MSKKMKKYMFMYISNITLVNQIIHNNKKDKV